VFSKVKPVHDYDDEVLPPAVSTHVGVAGNLLGGRCTANALWVYRAMYGRKKPISWRRRRLASLTGTTSITR
jgi:hypothetical protein